MEGHGFAHSDDGDLYMYKDNDPTAQMRNVSFPPNAPITQTYPGPPDDFGSCTCTTECSSVGGELSCCSKWGESCKPSCACTAGETCTNIWSSAAKERLFGPSSNGIECYPTPCFAHWYAAQMDPSNPRRADGASITGEINVSSLFNHIIHSSFIDAIRSDDGINSFFTELCKTGKTPELKQRLVRYALTTDNRDLLANSVENDDDDYEDGVGGPGCWFSLCRDTWEVEFEVEHCWTCGACRDFFDWHCGKCDKCTFGVCQCGGISEFMKK